GAYVRYSADEMYAILSIESHRHKTQLIGENLGTVPPEVNRSMRRHGVGGMYVVQYEQHGNAPPPTVPAECVASINTHDMPTLAAHLKGSDIAARVRLGLIPRTVAPPEREAREITKRGLIAFLRQTGFLRNPRAAPRDVLAATL